jgi:hypothetical protein
MSITQDMTQPAMRPPVGAIPDSFVAKIDPSEPVRLLSRSGDTDVAFRLRRGLSLLENLRDRGNAWLDRAEEYRSLLIASAVGLAVLATLTAVLGVAYKKPAPLAPPAKIAVPQIIPVPATAATGPVAAPPPARAAAPGRPRATRAKHTAKPAHPRHAAPR